MTVVVVVVEALTQSEGEDEPGAAEATGSESC